MRGVFKMAWKKFHRLCPMHPAAVWMTVFMVGWMLTVSPCLAQPPNDDASAGAEDGADVAAPKVFEVDDEVQEVLFPLFQAVLDAKVSRTTVEMHSETIVAGQVVDSQESVYQIASRLPNQFTVYFKEPEQRTRIYNNRERLWIALAPDAYIASDQPMTIAQAVNDLPIAMGTYPEPILALSLAGFDPAITFIGGMKSLKLVGRDPFRGKTPATHIRGVQDDLVSWDLWLADEKVPRPLRLTVDLTEMLRRSGQMKVPQGYQHQLRFDFLSWRVDGEVNESLFAYQPPKKARSYDSVRQYLESIAGVVDDHPLLGKPMPDFAAVMMDGSAAVSQDWKNRVVVLDFWSTWCRPCVEAMPTLQSVLNEFQDEEVVFLTVNVGESADKVRGFLKEQTWQLPVLLDPKGEIANRFQADAIPQRILIGKSGIVESVHVGFRSNDALAKQLRDELEVLCAGGKIASGDPQR